MKSPIRLVSVTSENSLTYSDNPFKKTIPINPELIKVLMIYSPVENQLTRSQAIIFNRVWTWRYHPGNFKWKDKKWDLRYDIKSLSDQLTMTENSTEQNMFLIGKKKWWKRRQRCIKFNDSLMQLSIKNATNLGVILNEKVNTKTKIHSDDKDITNIIGIKRDMSKV